MKLKKLLFCVAMCMAGISAFSQNANPFESIGKQGKILTLSKGQYNESFDQDSIQQIGTALVNVRQMKVVKLLKDEKEAQKLLDNSSSSRFLSIDPLTNTYPELTPYQFASNTPIQAIDIDGLEAGLSTVGINNYDPTGPYKGTREWLNEPLSKNQQAMGQGLMISLTGGEVDAVPTKRWQFYILALGQASKHYSGSVPGSTRMRSGVDLEVPQAPKASVNKTPETPELAHVTQQRTTATTDKATASAHGTTDAASPNTAAQGAETPASANLVAKKRQTLATNNQNSKLSEDIVYKRLNSQLGTDEAILPKPRIYIGDGSSGEWATPDFAVYNTKTGQLRRIVDAKDGGGDLSGPQKKLNEQGGTFNGSSRAPKAKAQSVAPGSVEVERTNVQATHP